MRFALAQLNFTVGAFEANFARVADAAARARAAGADLLVLSELATTGYPPRDLLNHASFIDASLALRDRIARLSDAQLGILVGAVEPNPGGNGKPLFNAAVLCHGGRIVARHHKTLLPTYDVFDEDRYFERGVSIEPMLFKGVRLGVTVCEEIWNDPGFWPQRLYARDPIAELAAAGASIFVNISSSPFTMGKAGLRREMIRQHAIKHRRPFLYLNQVGGNDELIFDGHSTGFDADGALLVRARDFDEDFVVVDLDTAGSPQNAGLKARLHEAPELREVSASREEEAWKALRLGLRDYTSKCGFSNVVLGLSGGIDSALTAALAADALGPSHVTGVAMPTRYSSDHSLRDAEQVARNLGIAFQVLPIDGIFQTYLEVLKPALPASDVAEQNLQARARGAVLMAFSNTLGSMLLSTGNKSELAVGYCTLYGDMCGGLAVISDVPKSLVYDLARYVNRQREIIPQSSLTKAPSAELKPNQTDQDTLPPYEILDRVIEAFVERDEDVATIAGSGLDRHLVEEIVRKITLNEYKRRQAAPGIKITSKAFGVGRRFPIAAEYPVLDEPVARS